MELNETDNKDLPSAKRLAVKYGLLWALVNIVVFIGFYYGFPQALGTTTQSAVQTVVGIGLAIFFTLKIRKEIGGFWPFREALSAIFVLFIIPSVIVYFFSVGFGKWVEPTYPAIITEVTLNTTTEIMEKVTDDQELIDQTIAETETALEKQFDPSFMDVVKVLMTSVLMYFIGALIWAAIFKKDRPVFYSASDDPQEDQDAGSY